MPVMVGGKYLGVLLICAAGLAGCAVSEQSAYDDGVRRAESELKDGTPCMYTTSMANVRQHEPHTGLPYLVIESPVTVQVLKMMEGHNITMLGRYSRSESDSVEQ